MNFGQTCLGPYSVACSTLDGEGTSYVDYTKSRRVVVINSCGSQPSPPEPDAIILHQELNCSNGSCDVRWYDCPSTMGRTYTIYITGCEITITSFENGLLSINECDGISYGSESFCFGKVYSANNTYSATKSCFSSFVFDDHHFTVEGNPSYDFGLFSCGNCWDEVAAFGGITPTTTESEGSGQSETTPPPDAEDVADDEADNVNIGLGLTGNVTESENRTLWHSEPSGDDDVGLDVKCKVSEPIPRPGVCSSQDNPSIAILRSGQAVVAYENRDNTGLSSIALILFQTSVPNSMKYHRNLGKGVLVNNPDLSVGKFLFYDDILIDSDEDGVVDETLKIGFVTGPARGNEPFTILSVNREVLENGRIRYTIEFDLAGREIVFKDSNDKSDVEWFLIKDNATPPTTDLTLPQHLDSSGNSVAMANPSIAIAPNNLGRDSDQNLFLTYQAFESGKWNVYLRHIVLSDKTEVSPAYQNIDFAEPSIVLIPATEDYAQAEYLVTDISAPSGKFCALFEVKINGEQLYSGLDEAIGVTTSGGLTYNKNRVYIEATFNTNSCGLSVPNWVPGVSSFIGSISPFAYELGWNGDQTCVSIDLYPGDIDSWHYGSYSCTQTLLFDDPYCPSPYLSATYKPEELYNLKIGDDLVTRVLYNFETNVVRDNVSVSDEVDFMFVIDHSASMGIPIQSVRQSVSNFAQQLSEVGSDFRFGFVIYARGIPSNGPNNSIASDPLICTCAFTFDGMDYTGSGTTNGFSRNISVLDTALSGWGVASAAANHFSAVQYAASDPKFGWRSTAKKFIFLITDTTTIECSECLPFSENINDAIDACNNNSISVILGIEDGSGPSGLDFTDTFLPLSEQTGWTGGVFPVRGTLNEEGLLTYDTAIDAIVGTFITQSTVGLTVVERDKAGYASTFLNRARLLVTYEGDLSDFWTQEKHNLKFVDNVPISMGTTKGLADLPFNLYPGQIYGIDSVHLFGSTDKWIYFSDPNQFKLSFPNLGSIPEGISDPILISENSARARVSVNHRNDVFVVYENFEYGIPSIEIKGTGDFAQDSITGAKSRRISKFLTIDDFSFNHPITLFGEGVNQICDLVVDMNDVVHVVWQSSRDKYWEIYYANGLNLFEPVRVTKSNSRSNAPRIDVDRNGSVFVVYHDNRFGVYDIMLSYKEQKRVIPLLQQDPYLASMSAQYKHYTNAIPITISNPTTEVPLPGALTATKISDYPGNDSENYIFKIDSEGFPIHGGETSPYKILACACSFDGYFYGITDENSYGLNTLLLLDIPEPEDPYIDVEVSQITTIGEVNLDGAVIVDMVHDYENRLWVMVIDQDDISSCRLVQIDQETADVLSETTIFDNIDTARGAIAADSTGKFWICVYQGGEVKVYSSEYPSIFGSILVFDFNFVANLAIRPQAFTTDENDTIFVLDGRNVYTMDELGQLSYLLTIDEVGEASDPYMGPYPVGTISGFAYQFSGQTRFEGSSGMFNAIIEFYDNINLEGEPHVVIDSRTNLDAFLTQQLLSDPYLPEDAYLVNARGIYLKSGESKVLVFDASLSRPESENLAYPYSFKKNQTYFPKVFSINPQGVVTEVVSGRSRSFSCNKCDEINANNPDLYACSYSFIAANDGVGDRYFNFQVDFFADQTRQSLIRRFELSSGSPDLQYVEVNNQPGSSAWNNDGLKIAPNSASFIQIYPALGSNDFVCGINYFTRLQSCSNNGDVPCTDFSVVSQSDWVSTSVDGTHKSGLQSDMMPFEDSVALVWIDPFQNRSNFTIFGSAIVEYITAFTTSLSMRQIGNKAAVVLVSSGNLVYAERQSENNWTYSHVAPGGALGSRAILREDHIGRPIIAFYQNNILKFAIKNGSSWTVESVATPNRIGEISLSVVDSTVYLRYEVFASGNVVQAFARKIDGGSWVVSIPSANFVPIPHDAVVVENQLFSIGTSGDKIVWGTSDKEDGLTWTVGGNILVPIPSGFTSKGSNIEIVNNQPNFTYTVDNGNNTYDIKVTRLVSQTLAENMWETITVDSNLEIQSLSYETSVSISPFRGSTAVFHGHSPLLLYSDQIKDSVTTSSDNFFCECFSTVHLNSSNFIGNVGRWISSAHGYSDTRVTDSIKDSVRPVIRTRSTDGAVILFEDYNKGDSASILGASFHNSNLDETFGSGTKSWFDYDLNISGRDTDLEVDIYDRTVLSYEFPDAVAGKGLSKNEIPGNQVFFKNCDFDPPPSDEQGGGPGEACDFKSLEDTVVSKDVFLEGGLIEKAIIHPEDILYFTYNASGNLTSVVNTCDVTIQAWMRPEVVAVRIKNEGNVKFSDWCPVTPEISEYHFERKWKLSSGAGIKEVCLQAMTYAGVTTQICIPIIADYEKTVFELNIYADDQYSEKLPTFDGMYVAATKIDTSSGKVKKEETVYIEIVPSIEVSETEINFDLLQQGANDRFDIPAVKSQDANGRTVFRGPITINKEDKVFNTDGLARIRVKIPGACDEGEFVASESQFSKDKYNVISSDSISVSQDITDPLSSYRQENTGKIGTSITLRPTEDPYFIFGDPNYFLKNDVPPQTGVKQEGDNE